MASLLDPPSQEQGPRVAFCSRCQWRFISVLMPHPVAFWWRVVQRLSVAFWWRSTQTACKYELGRVERGALLQRKGESERGCQGEREQGREGGSICVPPAGSSAAPFQCAPPAGFERNWHVSNSLGQILALAFRSTFCVVFS